MAAPQGIAVRECPWPVGETVSRLQAEIAARGANVFAVFDHSGEAHANALELRDTKVVAFGSPLAGTPVMEAVPLAALDLPLKVLVWDDSGQTRLAYVSPAALGARYGLPDELAARLGAVEAIANALLAA